MSNKYWIRVKNDNWVFGIDEDNRILRYSEVAIKRHTKVKGDSSPYDGNTIYWSNRMGKHPELKTSIARLLKKQKSKCNWCKLPFQEGEIIETDHITPTAVGGNQKDNLQLLHKHCHDTKTKNDLKTIKTYKVKKEWNETLKQFNKMNWIWINDIPTMV